MVFDTGRVCVKIAGREAGRYCVILKKEGDGFVLVTGPRDITKVRRRKCNVAHLEPLLEKLKISSDASDTEVIKAFEANDLFSKLKLKKLTREELKAMETARAEKAARKKAVAEKAEKEKAREDARKKAEEQKIKAEKKPEPKKEAPKAEPKKAEKPKK